MHVQCIKCNSLWGYIYPDTPLVHNHILGICTCMHVLCIQCTGLQGCTQSFMVFLQKDVHSIYTAQQLGGGIFTWYTIIYGVYVHFNVGGIFTRSYIWGLSTHLESMSSSLPEILLFLWSCVFNVETNVCIYNRISGTWGSTSRMPTSLSERQTSVYITEYLVHENDKSAYKKRYIYCRYTRH